MFAAGVKSRFSIRLTWGGACAALVVCAVLAERSRAADDPQSKPPAATSPAKNPANAPKSKSGPKALDDALLKDLDNELLEGAGDLKGPRKSKPAAKPAGGKPEGDRKPEGDGPLEQPEDGEDIGMPGEDADPLARVGQEMHSAERLIPEEANRRSAQQLQERIIEELAKLIDEAEKKSASEASQSKESKSQKTSKRQMVHQPKPGSKDSNKPATDSTNRLGHAEPARPDPASVKGMMKESWGHLPPHAREQLLQNWPERFVPQYELMIERYYKRLAEEQSSK